MPDLFDFTYDEKEFRKSINAFNTLQRHLPRYVEKVIRRFAGTFRKNVYAAIVKNAGWATKNWQPLDSRYMKSKRIKRFWYKSGWLQRHLKPNANALRIKSYGGSSGDIQVNLLEGLIDFKYYPTKNTGAGGESKGSGKGNVVSTYDVFMYMEYGTKRIPARPVVNPAFWRTLQMTDLGNELTKEVNTVLNRAF